MKTHVEHALCKMAQGNYEPMIRILDKIQDLSRAVDIAERIFKIPRIQAALTIRKIYIEASYH